MKRLIGILSSIGLLCTAGLTGAHAQDWPAKPIRVIVPSQAGGGVDIVARIATNALEKSLGQSLIVENVVGGNGTAGFRALLSSAPDGYTIAISNDSGVVVTPVLRADSEIDPASDFIPVARIVRIPMVLVVNPSLNVTTLEEFISLAKERPLKYGIASGIGNISHLAPEMLASVEGVKFVGVPYKGAPPAIVAAVAGEVDFLTFGMGQIAEHVRAGTLVALGTADRVLLKEIPTFSELGLPDFDPASWVGVFAPKGTPANIVDRLQEELTEIFTADSIKESLGEQGLLAAPLVGAEFEALVRAERIKWKKIIDDAGIKIE